MNLDDLVIHDSVILSVTEDVLNDNYIFLINWCNESGDGPYVKAELVFVDTLNYEVHEGAFEGSPTILEIIEIDKIKNQNVYRKHLNIETNAGYRTLSCRDVEIKHIY